jgi:hypothetical protein
LEPWHSIEKSGEPSDAAWRSGGFDGTTRQGQGKSLDFPAVWRLPPQKRTLALRTVVKPPLLLERELELSNPMSVDQTSDRALIRGHSPQELARPFLLGSGEDLLRRSGFGYASAFEEDHAVGNVAGELHLVRNDNHGHAFFGELAHDAQDLLPQLSSSK